MGLLLGCFVAVLLMNRLAGGNHGTPSAEYAWETAEAGENQAGDGSQQEVDNIETGTPSDALAAQEETEQEREKREHQAWLERYRRWHLVNRRSAEATEEPEEPYRPPVLMLASDLHYVSRTTYDDGAAFLAMMRNDDGKVSRYSDEIVDTLLEEAIRLKPSALLLTGDITLNGERENHEKLAEKLARVQEAGVQVLVIPGNHDIRNQSAATYFGAERKETEFLEDGQAFYEIYREFGYEQSLSRDEASLSYVYALDESHWLLLLDSCQYEERNLVNGWIRPETLFWMEEQLQAAEEQGVQVVTAAHHNLLSESRLYTTECTLENADQVTRLLESYEVPLYISGHLHAQRIKKHLSEPGADPDGYSISEIVLSPYSLPPCQYGVLSWNETDDLSFDTRSAQVAEYAKGQGIEDPFLLEFEQTGPEFLKEIIVNQVMNTIYTVPDDLKWQMAGLYAELYFDYCAGNPINRAEIRSEKAYQLWERVEPEHRYMLEMDQMMEDVRAAMHVWSGPGVMNGSGTRAD